MINSAEQHELNDKKYELLFSNMINGFAIHKIITDNKGQPIDYEFIDINPAFEKMTGLKKENLIGKKVTEALPGTENDPVGWIKKYGDVALTGKNIQFENYSEVLKKWFNITAYCTKKGYFATIFEDITETKEEKNFSNNLIDSIPGTFYMLDKNGMYIRWNNYQINEIVGTKDQIAKTNAIETIHPEDRALIQSKMSNIIKNGTVELVEGRVLIHGGPEFRWFLMTGRRIIINNEPFLIGIGIDITEHKKIEQALSESKSLTDNIVENIPLMIFLKDDQDLRFMLVNHACEELLGYDRKDLIGKNDNDFFPKDQAEFFIKNDLEVLEKNTIRDIPEEKVQTAKKGERILHTRKVCIQNIDSKKKYLLGISEDITQRKNEEEELKKYRENLQLKITELEKFHSLVIDRELKMIELKEKIKILEEKNKHA